MGNIDFSVVGLVLAVLTGIGSFFLGRYLRQRRLSGRRTRERLAAEATQSRQVRRARQRGERK